MDIFMKKDPPVLTMDEMRSSVKIIDDINERSIKAVDDLRDINQEEVIQNNHISIVFEYTIMKPIDAPIFYLKPFYYFTDVFRLGSIILSFTSKNPTIR